MKDVDERMITSIESASVLAGNSMKAPLEGDIIVIRDTLYGELKNVLDRDDPEKKLATDVADRAEQMTLTAERAEQMTLTAERAEQMKLTPKCQLNFGQLQKKAVGIVMVGFVVVVACILSTPFNRTDQLNNGEVRFVICATVCDVELTKKDIMNGIAATPDGRMAVGYSTGGIDIFSANGQLQKTVLKDVGICEVGYLSDGRYVVLNGNNNVTMYTKESEKLDVTFDSLSKDESGEFGGLAVDSKDLIYVAYRKAKKIQVFSPDGGKAIREIPCDGYTPMQITSYNDVLIIRGGNTVRIIDKDGNVKHKVEKLNAFGYPAVTQNNSILIAWVKHDRGLFSIDEYTSELKYVKTLISDHEIDKPETNWYYLREFRSGEIAFCTPDGLKTFKLTITPRSP